MLSLSQSRSTSAAIEIDNDNDDIFTPITKRYSDLSGFDIPLKQPPIESNSNSHHSDSHTGHSHIHSHPSHKSQQQLPIYEVDPSLSQHAMNKLVAIHEKISQSTLNLPGNKLIITPSIGGYTSSDNHSSNNIDIPNHDLHIYSPLHIHLNSNSKQSQRISITISDDTVITKPRPQSSNPSNGNSSMRSNDQIMSAISPLSEAPKKHKKHKYKHKNRDNHKPQLSATDTQLYGGPKPYFVKRYPDSKKRKNSDSIELKQSIDTYGMNQSNNEWFINNNNNYDNYYVSQRANNPFTQKKNKKIRNKKIKHKVQIDNAICNKYNRKSKEKKYRHEMHNENNNNNNYHYHFVDDDNVSISCANSNILY